MQIRCRNCGTAREIPKYHGSLLVTCPACEWQETLPARRHLSKSLDHGAGSAYTARTGHHRELRELLERLSLLSQRRFEQLCASMYIATGYDVVFADQIYDNSHALELRSGSEKVYVACRPGHHRVTVDELEGLAGSMRHDHASRAIFVTTGTFDEACLPFAADNGIVLIDKAALLERMMDVTVDQLREWIGPGEVAAPGQ